MTSEELHAERELLALLFRLARVVSHRHPLHDSSQLTMLQLQALSFVTERGSCTMGQLATELGVGLPSITALVGRLVKAGMLIREEDDRDRRVIRMRPTAAGKDRLRQQLDGEAEGLQTVINQLPERDRAAFIRVAQRLLDSAGRRDKQSPSLPALVQNDA